MKETASPRSARLHGRHCRFAEFVSPLGVVRSYRLLPEGAMNPIIAASGCLVGCLLNGLNCHACRDCGHKSRILATG
jgi:hypothetical protein